MSELRAQVGPVRHLLGACHAEADVSWDGGNAEAAQRHHNRCPGGLEVPVNKANPTGVVLCSCGLHANDRFCWACKTTVSESEPFDGELRRHANPEACEMALDRRRADNPTRAQIEQIRIDTEERRAKEREEANRQREARGEKPVAQRVKREKRDPQRCHDGCGGMTKGGLFVAGHDAKLKSTLHAAAKGEPDDPAYRGAILELTARGWLKPEEARHPYAEHADRTIEQQGASAVIAVAVATRYGHNQEETTG